ncbi:MAG: prepilin-type N-terminal cleavage/methylation domain-containing protein [Planctomycetota bacterium]
MRQSRTEHAHQAAFTLIELLVVVAVIALLIGLFLPALSKTRQGARTLQCLSGLRQVAIAESTYSEDHDGTIVFPDVPSIALWEDPENPGENISRNLKWFHLLGSYVDFSRSGVDRRSEIFRCPEFKPGFTEQQLIDGAALGKNLESRTGIGMNRRLLSPESRTRYHYVGPTIFDQFGSSFPTKLSPESDGVHDEDQSDYIAPPWRRSRVRAQSQRIFFGDSGGTYLDPSIASSTTTFWTNSLDAAGDPDASGDPRRHSGGAYRAMSQNQARDEDWLSGRANYLFGDGHASTLESLEAVQAIVDPLRTDYSIDTMVHALPGY